MFVRTLDDYLERFNTDQMLCFSDLWCLADSNYELIEKKHAWHKHLSKGGAVEEDDWFSTLIISHKSRFASHRDGARSRNQETSLFDREVAMDLGHKPIRGKVSIKAHTDPRQLFTFINHGCICR